MKQLTIQLNESGTARLRCYLHEKSFMPPMPAMLVCPGGGFNMHTPQENEPAALTFYAKGFQTFVLEYPLGLGAIYPTTLICAAKAIRMIRQNAEEWHLRPDAVTVIGYSAGAFVAGSAGTFWKKPEVQSAVDNCGAEIRPDAMVLMYPCVGSELPVLEDGVLSVKPFRCDLEVDHDTPPTFLVSTYEDRLVSCNQALNMALALSNADVPFEIHCYQPGGHAILGNALVGTADTGFRKQGVDTWLPDCLGWLRDLFQFPPKMRMPWEPPAEPEPPRQDPMAAIPRIHEDYYPAFNLPPMGPQPKGFNGNTPLVEVLANAEAAELIYEVIPWLRDCSFDASMNGMTINQCLVSVGQNESPFAPPDPNSLMSKLRKCFE